MDPGDECDCQKCQAVDLPQLFPEIGTPTVAIQLDFFFPEGVWTQEAPNSSSEV